MRISFKKWVFSLLFSVLGVIGVIVAVNCTVDTYGILRSDFSRQFQEPNHRFVKIKYLLGHKDKYDAFLFGSSRVLHIDNKKIGNGRCYNMGYSEGVPAEHLDHIRFLLKNGVPIRNLIIALDDFSGRVDPDTHRADLLRQPHYLISGKSLISFYSEYFVKASRFVTYLSRYIRHNYAKRKDPSAKVIVYDMYDSGREICPNCDKEIESDIEKHIHDPKFQKPYHYDGDSTARTLESLRALVSLAREKNIALTVFVNPIHQTTYLDTDLPLFFSFKQKLAGITDYYDFSGLNTITTNNYYYYEASHFRERVGDMMLKRMFGYPEVTVPSDFGVLVTSRNAGEHIRKQRQEVAGVKKPHLQKSQWDL